MRRSAPGSPPGTITPDPTADTTHVHVIAYGREQVLEEQDVSIARVAELRAVWPVVWINVVGLGNTETIQTIQNMFSIHGLVIEDVINVGQRPKLEEYDDYNFIVLRVVDTTLPALTEQLSMVLKDNCIITFTERATAHLDPVRERIRRSMGRLRSASADYLAYAILDTVIDHYVPVLEELGDRIEVLEQEIMAQPDPDLVGRIHDIRHEIHLLRRTVRPMLDVVGRLHNEEVPLFSHEVKPYLRDCLDHVVRLLETLDGHQDIAHGLMDLHLSSMSQRMNEIMKVLTIISTIFIPLNFIAGVYGMNFDTGVSPLNMPELHWYFGYPAALLVMLTVAVALVFYFHKKGWFGSSDLEKASEEESKQTAAGSSRKAAL